MSNRITIFIHVCKFIHKYITKYIYYYIIQGLHWQPRKSKISITQTFQKFMCKTSRDIIRYFSTVASEDLVYVSTVNVFICSSLKIA